MLQNGQSVTSAIKVVRNLLNVEDILSFKSPVLSVLVKYKSMLRLTMILLLISKQVLHCPPNQREEMSNITDSIPVPPSVSRTPE